MWRTRNYLDPVSLTLLALFAALCVHLVATSKHFHLYYMLASWILTGGVLVLAVIESRRLWPASPPLLCLRRRRAGVCPDGGGHAERYQARNGRMDGRNQVGARLSKAMVAAGPTCANVSRMFVQAPENHLNFGGDFTFATPPIEDRFSDAYQRLTKCRCWITISTVTYCSGIFTP